MPTKISVTVDTSQLLLKLRKGEKRLAFSTANAVNQTAIRIQAAHREAIQREFTVRKKDFILRQVAIIKPFANAKQNRPYAEISVGQRPRLLLSVFEAGGEKEPVKGRRVAVPITGSPARPTFRQSVPREFQFTRLRFKKSRPRGTTRSGRPRRQRSTGGVLYGEDGTYLLPKVGVFQRTDKGSELLYAFEESPELKARLNFVQRSRRVARRWFGEELQRQTIDALRHAGFR
jgi:hypothetical protein